MSEPLNTIPQVQNEPKQLERLAAQKQLYANAKTIVTIQLIITIPASVLLAVLVAYYPDTKVWVASYCMLVSILTPILFETSCSALRREAASIQELFDYDVFQFEWYIWKNVHRPDAERIHDVAKKYKLRDTKLDGLKDWYPASTGLLPIELARIVCQRANLWYDSNLRNRYAKAIIVILVSLSIVVYCIGLVGGMNIDKFVLAVIAPLMPVFLWGIRERKLQLETVKHIVQLKKHAETIWEGAKKSELSKDLLTIMSTRLQDHIFEHRKNSPLIPEWLYNRFRQEHEDQMNVGAEELVKEMLQAGGTNNKQ